MKVSCWSKQPRSSLSLILLLALILSPTAIGAELAASHRLVDEIDVEYGMQATFEVTLSNAGSEDLYDLSLIPLDPQPFIDPDASALLLDSLLAGESVSVQWVVETLLPAELLLRGRPILFVGEATDAFALAVHFPVASEEDVQP